MSRKIAPQIDIVRLEDKENKLKLFIKAVVEQGMGQGCAEAADRALLLVARSAGSPVAKAVFSLAREGIVEMPVRAIFSPADAADREAGSDEGDAGSLQMAVRIARDPRLAFAHEQLVLGASASWIGDSMRRDPMKRDAYECYAADCSRTAGWARISFERLWAVSESAAASGTGVIAPGVAEACIGTAAQGDEGGTTRSSPN